MLLLNILNWFKINYKILIFIVLIKRYLENKLIFKDYYKESRIGERIEGILDEGCNGYLKLIFFFYIE